MALEYAVTTIISKEERKGPQIVKNQWPLENERNSEYIQTHQKQRKD